MYDSDNATGILVGLIVAAVVILFGSLFFIHWKTSNEVVSGIVYNTKNDRFLSGNTTFSVRAAVDTYVSEENASSYCLPPGSPYIAVVNKAAMDKSVKVVVTENKAFKFIAPWKCMDNVVVREEAK